MDVVARVPPLMKVPEGRAIAYTAAVIASYFVVTAVPLVIVGLILMVS